MLELQASGHRIINLACSLGRPGDQERREAEARESSSRTGFELIIPSRPAAIGSGDDLDAAQAELAMLIAELVRQEAVDIVFSPSPHDRHPGHEVVGRATLDALSPLEDGAPAWWMWGLWADLPFPTLITYFRSERLRQILHALEAHAGELERNDYRRLVEGRARPTPSWAPSWCSASGAGEVEESSQSWRPRWSSRTGTGFSADRGSSTHVSPWSSRRVSRSPRGLWSRASHDASGRRAPDRSV